MYTKDESIVSQVAAKIASELATASGGDINTLITNFSIAYDAVEDALFSKMGFGADQSAAPFSGGNANVIAAQFGGNTEVQYEQPRANGITIKGTQHGPVPEWLVSAAAKAGVTEVWDNRDSAGPSHGNNKPLFKQVVPKGQEGIAFWAPRK